MRRARVRVMGEVRKGEVGVRGWMWFHHIFPTKRVLPPVEGLEGVGRGDVVGEDAAVGAAVEGHA